MLMRTGQDKDDLRNSRKSSTDSPSAVTRKDLDRLRKEGEILRKELERRLAPMRRVTAEDLRLRLR